ncbi:hypothetical protein [Gorillibacterium sp. CAU 1737]|uniref:hypothetical protein n=1 Tax=Gorillibacterium sp. CAU 1737 TaxID=3140362 RepID=UPI0032607F73
MFEVEIEHAFRITGRGYVIVGEVLARETVLRNGDFLRIRENEEQTVQVKAIEMVNFGSRTPTFNKIGLFVGLSEEESKALVGKHLYKNEEE